MMGSGALKDGAGVSRREFVVASAASALALPSWSFGDSVDGITPFASRVADASLRELNRRLKETRWPARETGAGWEQGPPLTALRDLTDYWRGDYDWRACEAELSRWPQFRTQLDGLNIHFLHVRSRHPNALPITLTHGWPSTILLFRHVIAPLTDPTSHGGVVADAFDVVIPSLPGFAFSDKPMERGWNSERIARAWSTLMQRLGYSRYVAQGGDWGAWVATAMAQQRAPGLAAIHLNFPEVIPDVIPDALLPDQKRAVQALEEYREKDSAFAQLQAQRPQTLGYALADSPAGHAAWLYDVFNAATGQTGRPENVLGRDQMLDEITLFWLTETAVSSTRLYFEQAQLFGKRNNPGRVQLPVAVSVFPNDRPSARSWAPLVYPQLFYWNEVDRGGHFAALEVPQLFVEEMRRAFRSFRHP